MSVTRINEFKAADRKGVELSAFLTSLTEYISSSDGCEECELLHNNDDATKFILIEKWATEEAHHHSVDNYPKGTMEAAMPLLGEIPKSDFYYH